MRESLTLGQQSLPVGAFLVLDRHHGKLIALYVVLGCGAIGAALQLTVTRREAAQ